MFFLKKRFKSKFSKSYIKKLLYEKHKITIDTCLFIQCKKCFVWQHGYCVGIFSMKDIPNNYWCKVCKPDLHLSINDKNDQNTFYIPLKEKYGTEFLNDYVFINSKKEILDSSQETLNSSSRLNLKKFISSKKLDEEEYINPELNINDNDCSNSMSKSSLFSSDLKIKNVFLNIDKCSKNLESVTNESKNTLIENKCLFPVFKISSENNCNERIQKKKIHKNNLKHYSTLNQSKNFNNDYKKTVNMNDINNSDLKKNKNKMINKVSNLYFIDKNISIYDLKKKITAVLLKLKKTQVELQKSEISELNFFDHNFSKSINNFHNKKNKILMVYDKNLQNIFSLTQKILKWEQYF